MQVLDFGRSMLQGRMEANRVRFWVESVTHLLDDRTGVHETYYQCGSCKSEVCFVPEGLFKQDNYDFLPIFGPTHGVIFRRNAWANEDYRSVVATNEMWGGQDYHLQPARGVQELPSDDLIIAATDAMHPLVGRVQMADQQSQLRAVIDFPIKTMNIRDQGRAWQVDTGPVALPDLTKRHDRLVDALSLAYVAFNSTQHAEVVIETKMTLGSGPGAAEVYHFNKLLAMATVNRVFAVTG